MDQVFLGHNQMPRSKPLTCTGFDKFGIESLGPRGLPALGSVIGVQRFRSHVQGFRFRVRVCFGLQCFIVLGAGLKASCLDPQPRRL